MNILKKSYHQSSMLTTTATVFEDNFVNVLDKHAPKKTNIFRGNHKPHVSKTLKLAIMKRSRLKNKANKTPLPRDKQNYKK